LTVWLAPFPGPGFSLRLRSGRRLSSVVETADPVPLLRSLADRAGLLDAEFALKHAIVLWAHEREAFGRPRWFHYLGKYVVFALLPAGVLFNAHQHIAYGGTFGQYYLEGFGPYAATLLVYWATTAIYLFLYGGVLRAAAEAVALLGAASAPERARGARQMAELGYRILYFGGVPVLLALRFSD
jgi:apolipoprotein N-acyltransferase